MAFSKKEKKEFIDYMKSSFDQHIEEYLNRNIIIINEKITLDIFKVYVDNQIFCNCDDFESLKKLYEVIVYNDESYQVFLKMIPYYLENNNIKIDKISILNSLFKNENYILKIMEQIKTINSTDCFDYIYDYILKSRKYYIDETAYFTSIIELIEMIKKDNYITKEKLQKYIDYGLNESKKIAGIYNVDEELLDSFSNRIVQLQQKIAELEYQEQTLSKSVNPMLEDVKTTIESADRQNIEMLKQMKKYSFNVQQSMQELKNDDNSNNTNLDYDKLREYAKKELPKIYSYIRNKTGENINDYSNEEVIIDKIVELLKDNNSLELQENNIKKLSYYMYADYKNNLDIYLAIIKNKTIDEIAFYWFNSKISEVFNDNRNLYIHILLKNDSAITDAWSYKDGLNTLKQLYSINPNVNLTFKVYKLMEAIKYFDITDIANNELLMHNLDIIDSDEFKHYKEIYSINPYYEIYSCYTILIPNNIFTMEEMSEFNFTQQHAFFKLVNDIDLKNGKYDSYQDIIRNIVYYNNLTEENIDSRINSNTIYLLKQTGLSVDELLNLSDDEYNNIVDIYKGSHLNVANLGDLIYKNNNKQKLKKMKRKNIRKK